MNNNSSNDDDDGDENVILSSWHIIVKVHAVCLMNADHALSGCRASNQPSGLRLLVCFWPLLFSSSAAIFIITGPECLC